MLFTTNSTLIIYNMFIIVYYLMLLNSPQLFKHDNCSPQTSQKKVIAQSCYQSSCLFFSCCRSQSFRQGPLNANSRSQSHTYVNSSISANPLLPIDTGLYLIFGII